MVTIPPPPLLLLHTRPVHESRTESPSVECLLRDAHVILDNCEVVMSPGNVKSMVRRFARQSEGGFTLFDYIANAVQLTMARRAKALANLDVRRVIRYADPTGEDACYNVMRAAR